MLFRDKGIFSFPETSRPTVEHTQAFIKWIMVGSFLVDISAVK